jgi:hypothetical protein
MTPLRRALVLLPVLAPVLAAGGAGAADDAACGAPPELLEPGAPLPATARAVSGSGKNLGQAAWLSRADRPG